MRVKSYNGSVKISFDDNDGDASLLEGYAMSEELGGEPVDWREEIGNLTGMPAEAFDELPMVSLEELRWWSGKGRWP